MNRLCGIAINRFGLTSREFYQLTPVEFHWALADHRDTHYTPMKRICETLRMVAVTIHNSTPGRKAHHIIRAAERLFALPWEQNEPRIQSVEEMKAVMLGMSHHKGVRVTQKGKEVKFDGDR